MTPPSLRGKRMDTFFHLLGNNENAMTISLGWCMSQVPSFLDCLGDALDTPNLSTHNAIIRLQKHQRGTGITDLEIYAPGYAAWIIEAKRGFTVPSADQLERFSVRLAQPDYRSTKRGLVVLAASDRNNQWLSRKLPHRIGLIPFHALSWREIQRMAEEARNDAGRSGKNLLRQFHTYLGSEGNMQDQHSNWLYVVSLSRSTFGGGVTKFIDVVERHRMYFHPVGGGPLAVGRSSPPTTWRSDTTGSYNPSITSTTMMSSPTWDRFSQINRARSGIRPFCIALVHRSVQLERSQLEGTGGQEGFGALSIHYSLPTPSPRPWKLQSNG